MSTALKPPRVSLRWLRDILTALYKIRPATRAEVGAQASLNTASVSRGLQQLIEAGIISKLGERDSGGGRPREILSLNPESGFFIAVDLEGVAVRFAVTDLLGGIRHRWEEYVPLGHVLPAERVLFGIDTVLKALTPAQAARLQAIGVSFPGFLSPDGLLTAVNLGWRDVPLERMLQDRYALPVFLERDEATCIRAERSHGRAKDARNWIYLIVGNGVGVGLVVDGRRVSGHAAMSGELGHMTVDTASTLKCPCGKFGCVETIAATPAIIEHYGRLSGRPPATLADISLRSIFDKARGREPAALQTLHRAAQALGLALSHAVNLLNPESILLGGDLPPGHDVFIPMLRDEINRHALPQLAAKLDIAASTLGPDVRLHGAASLAFHRCANRPDLLKRLCGQRV